MAEDLSHLSPVQVERKILDAANEVAEGIGVISRYLHASDEATREFDKAWAKAYLAATGTVAEREAHCTLATMAERQAKELAAAAYKYADRRTKAAESRMSAYQSVLKSIMQAYGAAGVGER